MNRQILTEPFDGDWIDAGEVVESVSPALLREVYAEAIGEVFAGARAIAAEQAAQAVRVERARRAGIALRHTDRSTGGPRWSALCTSHHKVKHHTEWRIEQRPGADGWPASIVWTSPAGYEYITEPTPIGPNASRFGKNRKSKTPTKEGRPPF